MSTIKLKGYRRTYSLFGIRNHIVVMSTVSCANSVVEQIARADAVADEIFEFLLDVCNAKQTAAEVNNCKEFAVNRIGPAF